MGVVEEEKIDNMSYVFFQDVLGALKKRVDFESISNLYGRTILDKKAGDSINKTIEQANPLTKPSTSNSAAVLMAMPSEMRIVKASTKEQQMKNLQEVLGDTSWFEEYLK